MNASDYYINGFSYQETKDSPEKSRLLALLSDLKKGVVKDGYEFAEKYQRSADLRPEVYTYDPVFIDFLIEQKVPETIRSLTGMNLNLIHIQLRHSFPGKSYMIWHRDTHFYRGKKVGNSPPVHKMIYYPALGAKPNKKLSVIPGSHRLMLPFWVLDQMLARLSRKTRIISSDEKLLFFNTSILHNVENEIDPEGSIRIIYTFADTKNLKALPGGQGLVDAYKQKHGK